MSRVWQLACLEEEIPDVRDHHVYDIAHLSFLIVRTAPDEIKAYRNACLHRGRSHGDAIDVDAISDAELIDPIFLSVFPNWSPWGCFNPIMYRFRPNGDDPDECSRK